MKENQIFFIFILFLIFDRIARPFLNGVDVVVGLPGHGVEVVVVVVGLPGHGDSLVDLVKLDGFVNSIVEFSFLVRLKLLGLKKGALLDAWLRFMLESGYPDSSSRSFFGIHALNPLFVHVLVE